MGAGSGMGTHERLLQMGLFALLPLNMSKLSWFCDDVRSGLLGWIPSAGGNTHNSRCCLLWRCASSPK